MKSLLVTAAMLLAVTFPAMAQTTATGTGTSSSNSAAQAISGGGGGGSAQAGGGAASVVFNQPGETRSTNNSAIRYRQSGSLKTTPTAAAPGLGSAGIETCYGPGVSAGISVTGFGGSFGAGQWDRDCNARLYSRTLFAMGYKQQAIQILVNESPIVASAFGLGQGGGAAAAPVVARRAVAAPTTYRPMALNGGGCKKFLYGPGSPCVVRE